MLTQDEGAALTESRDTSILQSRDSSKASYFLNHRSYASETEQGAGYSVVITIEVFTEGNRLMQVSAYFHLLSKNICIKCERSCRDATESLCSPKKTTKTPTRTKNDEMNQIMTIQKFICITVSVNPEAVFLEEAATKGVQ